MGEFVPIPSVLNYLFRPFKPKRGFKKDRREGQIAKPQQGGGKHIDLKALRNNE